MCEIHPLPPSSYSLHSSGVTRMRESHLEDFLLWEKQEQVKKRQAGAELGQAQDKLDDIVVVVVEVVVEAMVEV